MIALEEQAQPATSPHPAWGLELTPVYCPVCKTSFLHSSGAGGDCPDCHAAKLSPLDRNPVEASPELILPFRIDPDGASSQLASWTRGIWLHPADLTPQALSSRLTRLMLPMWLVDGQVHGSWQCRAGYEYQVSSSFDAYQDGRWTSRPITETRLRWEPRAGTLERSYQNLAVPALRDHTALFGRLGTYPLREAVTYQSALLSEAAVRLPEQTDAQAWPLARTQFERAAEKDCQVASTAQRMEEFMLDANYSNLMWTLLLLPIYTTWYRDDQANLVPVMINGITGQVSGIRRASQSAGWRWTGILAGAGIACLLLAALLTVAIALFPPAAAVGVVLFVIGGLALGAAPVPAIWAWQFNRSDEP